MYHCSMRRRLIKLSCIKKKRNHMSLRFIYINNDNDDGEKQAHNHSVFLLSLLFKKKTVFCIWFWLLNAMLLFCVCLMNIHMARKLEKKIVIFIILFLVFNFVIHIHYFSLPIFFLFRLLFFSGKKINHYIQMIHDLVFFFFLIQVFGEFVFVSNSNEWRKKKWIYIMVFSLTMIIMKWDFFLLVEK